MTDRPEHDSLIRVEDIIAALPVVARALAAIIERLDRIEAALAAAPPVGDGGTLPRVGGWH